MSSGPQPLFIIGTSTCCVCDRGRLSVPALVELRPDRVVCSECVTQAVEALVGHYGRADDLVPLEPVPA